jgi:hypothetical protein
MLADLAKPPNVIPPLIEVVASATPNSQPWFAWPVVVISQYHLPDDFPTVARTVAALSVVCVATRSPPERVMSVPYLPDSTSRN